MPFLLLIAWIVAEAWIVARLAERFGSTAVLIWLIAAVVAGSIVIRRQGMRSIREIQIATARGELPANALIGGAIGLAAGLLLILPGLLSDLVAISLLFGGLRRRLAHKVSDGIAKARPDLKAPVTLEGDYTRRE